MIPTGSYPLILFILYALLLMGTGLNVALRKEEKKQPVPPISSRMWSGRMFLGLLIFILLSLIWIVLLINAAENINLTVFGGYVLIQVIAWTLVAGVFIFLGIFLGNISTKAIFRDPIQLRRVAGSREKALEWSHKEKRRKQLVTLFVGLFGCLLTFGVATWGSNLGKDLNMLMAMAFGAGFMPVLILNQKESTTGQGYSSSEKSGSGNLLSELLEFIRDIDVGKRGSEKKDFDGGGATGKW